MTQPENTPNFPNIVPDSIKGTNLWVYENDDFKSREDISELWGNMYNYPEDAFFLFTPKDQPINPLVSSASLIVVETQGHYYPHPQFKRDYVRIRETSVQFDWERDVLAQGNMFCRHQLKLSERARRTFEIQQLLVMQKASNSNPIKLEPNFMGIGIDLRKAYTWLKQQFKK